jgi:hypothetical protein
MRFGKVHLFIHDGVGRSRRNVGVEWLLPARKRIRCYPKLKRITSVKKMGQPLSEDDIRLFGMTERETEWNRKVLLYIYGTGLTVYVTMLLYKLF